MDSVAKIYEQTRIRTSSNPRIIYLLHNKCVQLVQLARSADNNQKRELLVRAQNILAELEHALVIDDELSQGLFYIYDYCYSQLETEDSSGIELTIPLMSLLRDTFSQLLQEPH